MTINEKIAKIREVFCDGDNAKFAKMIGKQPQYASNICKGKNVGEKLKEQILDIFPQVNRVWLLTGEGEMLKSEGGEMQICGQGKGVPYYDVDFIGGFDLVANNQTAKPAYHINFEEYNRADCWVNVTGHSMEPAISHGDIVALKEVQDWETYILYGEVYAIVTDEYRTIKKVRKSQRGDEYIKIIPTNTEYDEQDIPVSVVRKVFQVLGSAKKLF